MTPIERWLPVVGYEGLYEVSDHGRVRSLDRPPAPASSRYQPKGRRGRVLKPVSDGDYLTVTLTGAGRRKNQYVHRLVLEAFVGPCPDGMESLHDDGNSHNNAADNLNWGTSTKNNKDRDRHGTLPKGIAVYNSKLTEQDVKIIREFRPMFSLRQLSDAMGVSASCISQVARGTIWRHVL